MSIDFSDDAPSTPTKADLSVVANLATLALAAKAEIEAAEEDLARMKARYRGLIENDIPDAMQTVGFKSIKLEDGRSITVKDDVKASLPKSRAEEACEWLIEHGHGGLIKRDVDIKLPRNYDPAPLFASLVAAGLPFDATPTVHPQTLAAFLREQLAAGNDVPLELFGAYEYRTTSIKG